MEKRVIADLRYTYTDRMKNTSESSTQRTIKTQLSRRNARKNKAIKKDDVFIA